MKILREAYTEEEVKQRVIEARNAIGNLQDNLYILLSALEDTKDFRRSYVQDYVEQVEDLGSSFEADFEDIIYPQQEEDELEEDSFNENLTNDNDR